MPIVRSTEQGSITLEAFYSDLSAGAGAYGEVGKSMLLLIGMINELFPETRLWGLTSVARLVIQNEDRSSADWYVIISNLGETFFIEYLLPRHKQPWNNAYVKGEAGSLEAARTYLLVAMRESEGWIDSMELKRLTSLL